MKRSMTLSTAIFFVVNAVIGSGIFLNVPVLINNLNNFSWLAYLLVGIFFIPLVLICYQLTKAFPGYTMHEFFALNGKKFAHYSIASYVVGKLATATICIILPIKLIFGYAPLSVPFNIMFILFFGLALLGAIKNKSSGPTIQFFLFLGKILPIVITVFYGLMQIFLNNKENLCNNQIEISFNYYKFFSVVPIVIFAFAGFELLFSLANLVHDPSKTINKAICAGFSLIVFLYTIYQYFIGFINVHSMPLWLSQTIICFIGLAAYGVAYNIIFAQCNNLKRIMGMALINDNNIKKNNIIIATMLIQIVIGYTILFSLKDFFILQQLSATGTIIVYVTLIYTYIKNSLNSLQSLTFNKAILIIFSMITVLIMIFSSIYSAIAFGVWGYTSYALSLLLLLLALSSYSYINCKK